MDPESVHSWLETSLTRFQGPMSYDERTKLDAQLVDFQKSSEAFVFALQVLEFSSSPLVLHFAASTVERVVSTKWSILPFDVKERTRNGLIHFLGFRSSVL